MKSKSLTLNLNLGPLESVRLQLDLMINYTYKGVVLNSTELIYLAYFTLYGVDGRKKIIDDSISLNSQVWSNMLYKFRNLGIVQGVRKDTILNPKLKIEYDENYSYNLVIKPKDNATRVNDVS